MARIMRTCDLRYPDWSRADALRIDRGVTHSRDMQCVHSMSPSLGGERESLHRAARHTQKPAEHRY
ncbi:hypothetical protein [Xanthomonas campestris]|uniref:hypothetical protein n=1 Tax=Xanthomonas campestris TaxID=339 RepID=UPI002B223483|nr:hypothetical protein [Xanthomonas campestris]MEA9770996.1 hypothetical protein [Xanthomonas campestris pv. raphani]MEA9799115.1 hypothetical protein [Xanthomonas campestris pv. raphani]MEA9832898.1 hypothetical protein [Xanthomonas campestris pv. raphani]MEA9914366.1 hypothetical protein [Xanthomonas campestris pv. raphani]MEA9920681.1 hypothetical protein [Xanthomonas campestris pv. raphani]